MSVYWMTEAVPLAVTSFIPVILFPLLDVLDTDKVCNAYLKETNMMFIGEYMYLISFLRVVVIPCTFKYNYHTNIF
jgi:sodium-dependent dicarboxylate transporter 2/3/5